MPPVSKQQPNTSFRVNGAAIANGAANVGNGPQVVAKPQGSTHEHGAALVQARPPQFLVTPQATTAKPGETVQFIAKVAGTPTPSIEWVRSDGRVLQSGDKYTVEATSDGTSKLTLANVCSFGAFSIQRSF